MTQSISAGKLQLFNKFKSIKCKKEQQKLKGKNFVQRSTYEKRIIRHSQ